MKSTSTITPSGSARGVAVVETVVTGAVMARTTPSAPDGRPTAVASRSRPAASLVFTTSSMGPSWVRAESRTDAPRLSPTMNDAVMMAVPRSDPATTSRASPRRRPMLRSASRRNVGQRAAS